MAEQEYPPLVMPDGVERRAVTVWSNGLALDADLYRPTVLATEARLPAVVLGHGWGGSKLTAERYAALFAADGMITLAFTQPSWFGSAGPLQREGPTNALSDGPGSVEVREIRDLVDPYAWIASTRSALDFLEGEPGVDRKRMGLWGTSFGGGIAVQQTASDARVKALVVQVPFLSGMQGQARELAHQRAVATARGEAPAMPQGVDPYGSLTGTPFMAHFAHYVPLSEIERVRVPTLIIDAGDEEMFPISDNGGAAAKALEQAGVPVEYFVVPGIGHYGIYFDGYDEGSKRARDWWARHL